MYINRYYYSVAMKATNSPKIIKVMDALSRVLDVLCMDFTGVPDTIESLFYSFGGIRIPKRPGRRRRKRAATEDGGFGGHRYVNMGIG